MDELRQQVFWDDRQVACLDVHIWKSIDKSEPTKQDSVRIKVERVADYQQRFDAACELGYDSRFRFDRWEHEWDNEFEIDLEFLVRHASPEVAESLTRYHLERRQRLMLGGDRIQPWDRPGITNKNIYKRLIRRPSPLSIEVGYLPGVGETAYKKMMRRNFQEFAQKYKLLRDLRIPVILDVQVFAKKSRTSKDLDNVMRDIVPIFSEFLTDPNILMGYRIYVTESGRHDLQSDFVRLKILPEDALWNLDRDFDDILDKARDEIDL